MSVLSVFPFFWACLLCLSVPVHCTLWPQPVRVSRPPGEVRPYRLVRHGFRIERAPTSITRQCDVIDWNVARYQQLIEDFIASAGTVVATGCAARPLVAGRAIGEQQQQQQQQHPLLTHLYLSIDDVGDCDRPQAPNYLDAGGGLSEEYYLDIHNTSGRALIQATNIWGAVRALETFYQLLYHHHPAHQPCDPNQATSVVLVNITQVLDHPRFAYRGLMLDTARHYVPLELLRLNLEAMQANKLNILHWHLSDDQSVGWTSNTHDNFSHLAAPSPCHVYRAEDIAAVVSEARLRGIQTIVEFDTPAHVGALARVFPEIAIECGDKENGGQRQRRQQQQQQQIDVSREASLRVLADIWTELARMFPSAYLHLGMDDIDLACWARSPPVLAFAEAAQLGNTSTALLQYYVDRLLAILERDERHPIMWQDAFDLGVALPANAIVEVWKDELETGGRGRWPEHIGKVTRAGHRAVLTACWFLNLVHYGADWRRFYRCDPQPSNLGETQKKLVIGGEASLWGEYVDENNFFQRIWPRTAALAERLWSPAEVGRHDTDDQIVVRLSRHRCRMLAYRNIPAEPLGPDVCNRFVNQFETTYRYGKDYYGSIDDDDDEDLSSESYQSSKRKRKTTTTTTSTRPGVSSIDCRSMYRSPSSSPSPRPRPLTHLTMSSSTSSSPSVHVLLVPLPLITLLLL